MSRVNDNICLPGLRQRVDVIKQTYDHRDSTLRSHSADQKSTKISVSPALRCHQLEQANALLSRIYRNHGLRSERSRRELRADLVFPDRFTLLAEDEFDEPVATVSLTFDVDGFLPCEEIFGMEMQVLRNSGRRVCEVTELALTRSIGRPKSVLVCLFNLIYLYAHKLKGFDDFVIEVHPKHVAYYIRLLGFEIMGASRPCPRVAQAPAILLRLDLDVGERQIRKWAGKKIQAGESKDGFSLYPHFMVLREEVDVLKWLNNHVLDFCADLD